MPEAVRAAVVVDLGFGDAGKGLVTDHLVRTRGARLVVRYNGGAQAGHNVVTPGGRHHTFSQWGAGSFVDGVGTFLSRHVVVHPTALLAEAAALEDRGVPAPLDRLAVDRRARVVTPFHQARGRLRELARGDGRHGSCGVGIGETVGHGLAYPEEVVTAGDLGSGDRLARQLEAVRHRLLRDAGTLPEHLADHPAATAEREILETADVTRTWCETVAEVAEGVALVDDGWLARRLEGAGSVVFEGAQGVLLDQWHGFHPHTTWSDCTPAQALALLAEAAPGAEVERIGVVRCHAVRHGAGPLPTESPEVGAAVVEHNRTGPWQGSVRHGWFDAVLARYALDVAGPLETLAVTHLDAPGRRGSWCLARAYRLPRGADPDLTEGPTTEGVIECLRPSFDRDLARQERLNRLLGAVEPVYDEVPPEPAAVVQALERALGRPVDLVSRGPQSSDVAARSVL